MSQNPRRTTNPATRAQKESFTPYEWGQEESQSMLAALDRSQAVIEFTMDATVTNANQNFLDLTGYELSEIQGSHHKMFVTESEANSKAYQEFWDNLQKGTFSSGEFKRITKDRREVWIQATYNPVMDESGKPIKVVKIATDVTNRHNERFDLLAKVDAVNRSQAAIEFDLDGHILAANQVFLDLMGYRESEIVGQHHRMFVEDKEASTLDYTRFWERLRRGEFQSGEFKRVGSKGQEVWIQATYNPVLDTEGRAVKVVKYASDVTAARLASAEYESKLSAIDKSQAVIEFEPNGTILSANRNFLGAMGYLSHEIEGQHHSMFCDREYLQSEEYRDFWIRLSEGQFMSGRFRRMGKYDRTVWIQASYNPVRDINGKVVKVVKYAYDVTREVELEQRISAKCREMATSIDSITQTISRITDDSQAAERLAQESTTQATGGLQAVEQSMASIDSIQRSSDRIAEIVEVIGEIANQTNLLAFNAAIEAERAGEHGVGFSVVASEVRKLAERSSDAAGEITKVIGEATEQVAQGASVSREASDKFTHIREGILATEEKVRAIASSSNNQQALAQEVATIIKDLEIHG